MSDIDYGKGTWHLHDDGRFVIYSGGVAVAEITFTAPQLVGLMNDMSRVAWRMMARTPNVGQS